jgi:hypothetical protein
MGAKTSKPNYASLITKILVVLVILNIAGDVLAAAFFLWDPSLGELSVYGGLIASFAGKNGAVMTTSAILLGYATVYAIAAFGLLSKLKWAPPLVIAVSVVNRALALGVIFEPNGAWIIWSAWKLVIIALAFYLLRKHNSAELRENIESK